MVAYMMVRYDNIISKKQCSTPENKKCVFQPYQPLYCMAKAGARFSFPLSSKKTHSYFKTCCDIREASAFWGAMDIGSQHDEPSSWLSTPPSHADRQQLFDNLMDEAIAI